MVEDAGTPYKPNWPLTETQRRVVMAPSGRRVFLGGPGSGKTTAIVERVAWLRGTAQVRAEAILILAPEPRASRALETAIRHRLGASAIPTVTSFHGFASNVLRHYYREMGFTEYPVLVDRNGQRQRLGALSAVLRGQPPTGSSLTSHQAMQLAYDLAAGLPENGLVEADLGSLPAAWTALHEPALVLYRRYRESMERDAALDFGTLLARVAAALRNPPIGESLRRLHRHVLVDELEQASYVQAEILFNLVGEETDLLVAGDPDQAIGGYQHGNPLYLAGCAARLGAQVHSSSDNLRTAGRLGSLVSGLRPSAVPDHSDEASGHEGMSECPAGRDSYVVVHPFSEPAAEARWVADEVRSLERSGIPLSQMAVLLRGLRHPLQALLSQELDRRRIAHHGPADVQIAGEPLVRATVDLLRVIAGLDAEGQAIGRLLRSRLAGLPPFGAEDLRRAVEAAGLALGDAVDGTDLPLSPPVAVAWWRLRRIMDSLREKAGWPATALVWEIWRVFPAWRDDARHGGSGSTALRVFLDTLSRAADQGFAATVPEVLRLWDSGYFSHLVARGADRGGLEVTTVHQAKGREWTVVFLPGLLEGEFPVRPSETDTVTSFLSRAVFDRAKQSAADLPGYERTRRDEHVAEEARVFYVAASRARTGLYLSYSLRRADGGAAPLPSRFARIVELREEGEVIAGDVPAGLPADPTEAVLHYRQLLAAGDPLERAAAVYALARLTVDWPFDGAPEEWWENVRETTGAGKPFAAGQLHLSASRLKQYLDCPLAYQFGYHWEVADPGSPALTVGNVLHAVLQEYHGTGSARPRTLETLRELLESHFDATAFPYRPIAKQAKTDLWTMLEKYFGRYGLATGALATEQSFRFAYGPHTLRGFIDRIDRRPSGGLEIVDYKSGTAMSLAEAQDDVQLALYDLAFYLDPILRDLGRPEQVSYLYPRTIGPRADGRRSYTPTEETRSRLRATIDYCVEGLLAGRFPRYGSAGAAFPGRSAPRDPCRVCRFQWLCPRSERG